MKVASILLLAMFGLVIGAGRLPAQNFKVLHTFGTQDSQTGFNPQAKLIQGPDGTLYGTASEGDSAGNYEGTVFKVQSDGSGYTVLKIFTNDIEGANPEAEVLLNGGTLYGTTYSGGLYDYGVVFKVNTDGSGFAVLHSFTNNYSDGDYNGSDGANPQAGLVLSGSNLFGTTLYGGDFNNGTVFKVDTNGMVFGVLKSFTGYAAGNSGVNSDGANPQAGLALSGNVLYGAAKYGGLFGNGTIFKLNTDGSGFGVLKVFSALSEDYSGYSGNSDGAVPEGTLLVNGAELYGTTAYEGTNSGGAVFKLNTSGSNFMVLENFETANYGSSTGGANPGAGLALSGNTLYGTTSQGGNSFAGTVFSVNTNGGGFTVLYSIASIIFPDNNEQGGVLLNGNSLYGTSFLGGLGYGTIFQINTSNGQYKTLYLFSNTTDGAEPYGTLAVNGNALYGTTFAGGDIEANGFYSGFGTVFKVNMDGTGYSNLYSFTNSPDAQSPFAGLAQSGNTFYGVTSEGGAAGNGAIYKINTDGTGYSVLYSFQGTPDGRGPFTGLVVSGNTLYGTTSGGGDFSEGTVFKIATDGSDYSVMKSFSELDTNYFNDDGAFPKGLALSGNVLYGITVDGGENGNGTVFSIGTDGNNFKTLYTFSALDPDASTNDDGAQPQTPVVLSGNTLYGTTASGGNFDEGTLFKLNTDGSSFAALHQFSGGGDGGEPLGGIVLNDNTIFGTAYRGGGFGYGLVFQANTDGTGFAPAYSFTGGADGGNPESGLAISGSTLFGTASDYTGVTVAFSLSVIPTLHIMEDAQGLIVYWQDDGQTYTLQTAGNLTGNAWTTAPPVNWSSTSNGIMYVGLQLSPPLSAAAYYRLK